MIRLFAFALSFLLIVGSADAQTAAPPNPQEQIERTIGNLFIANTNLTSQVQSLQAQIAEMQKQTKPGLADDLVKAQARIKELETKAEKPKE
jgi:peptidoglycan hydrolase CwlO-like protein